jgi:hypothetical protein
VRRVIDDEGHELLAQRLAARCKQGLAADEAGLVQSHGELQSGLERRLVRPQLRAPGAAPGLNAQGVQRVVAGVAQAQVGPGVHQRQVDMARHRPRHIELEARAAHIGHAGGAD